MFSLFIQRTMSSVLLKAPLKEYNFFLPFTSVISSVSGSFGHGNMKLIYLWNRPKWFPTSLATADAKEIQSESIDVSWGRNEHLMTQMTQNSRHLYWSSPFGGFQRLNTWTISIMDSLISQDLLRGSKFITNLDLLQSPSAKRH